MSPSSTKVRLRGLTGVVGLLAVLEFTSGVLQGYYIPLFTDIARHLGIHDADVNWFEGTQLMAAAISVPALAKLGDLYGYRRILLWSIAVTAVSLGAFAALPNFTFALIAWTVAAVSAVWLPLDIALIWARSQRFASPAGMTSRAAGFLVASLQVGAIVGALVAGQIIEWLPLEVTLVIPAVAVGLCFFAVYFGVPDAGEPTRSAFDTRGFVVLSLALVIFMSGLSLLRLFGPANVLPWAAIVVGVLLLWPFARLELGHPDPLIDVRMFRSRTLLPIFLTAGLFGGSVLGSQIPLSTFARTDPAEVGYGWGASSGVVSILIGLYVIWGVIGALLYPTLSRRLTPRTVLVGASLLVAFGYFLFIPFHDTPVNGIINLAFAGLGAGAMVAALPAAAATAAPRQQTGVATGLTNAVKTAGGAIASAVFGIALLGAVASDGTSHTTAGSLSGYLLVWGVCAAVGVASAGLLAFMVPRDAFQDRPHAADVADAAAVAGTPAAQPRSASHPRNKK